MSFHFPRTAAALVLVSAIGCEPAPTSSAPTSATSTMPSAAPATSTETPAAPAAPAAPSRASLPPIETACTADADCDVYMEGSAKDPCCPVCDTYKGGTKTSLAKFRAACPSVCGFSCVAAPSHAACTAGKCVAVKDKS